MDESPRRDPCVCANCGKPLSNDEVAITKKLVNRAAQEYLCAACLAARFSITTDDIARLIRHFREAGCSLFS